MDPRQFEDIVFFVPGTPVAQPRHQSGKFGSYIKRRKNGQPHPIHAWKSAVENIALRHKLDKPLDGPIGVELTFFMPRPKTVSKIIGHAREAWAATKRRNDRDNLDKAVLDALTNISFFVDDGCVCDGAPRKVIAAEGKRPGVRVRVFALGEPPTQ